MRGNWNNIGINKRGCLRISKKELETMKMKLDPITGKQIVEVSLCRVKAIILYLNSANSISLFVNLINT